MHFDVRQDDLLAHCLGFFYRRAPTFECGRLKYGYGVMHKTNHLDVWHSTQANEAITETRILCGFEQVWHISWVSGFQHRAGTDDTNILGCKAQRIHDYRVVLMFPELI